MEKTDYQKLGFKCGLECHQQLEGKKLFCKCLTLNSDALSDIKFERRLRAVVGETGEVDIAAVHEMKKGKKFYYEGDSADCCLLEMDEEPPHSINKDAVEAALQVASLMKARVVDEIQVMRKTVVDGSNTTGFQRTCLVAYDGYIETSLGKVSIPTICLEEEACQRISETNKIVKYRLDRLGIPLIEVATDSSIKTPEHAKEAAEKIGMILRSTGKCKRGIGTIRQDVNISIKDGARTEIKGFQELKLIPFVINNEIKRQQEEIKKGKKLEKEVRKAEPDGTTSFLRPMPGAARMYPETDVVPFKVHLKELKKIELIEDKARRYELLGISKDLALFLAKSDKAEMFDRFVKEFKNIKPAFIAETLISAVREIKRKFDVEVEHIGEKEFEEIFSALDKGRIPKSAVMNILIDHAHGRFESIEKYKAEEVGNLEEEIKKIISENPGQRTGYYMGIIMKKFAGKVDGKKVIEIIKKFVKE